MTASVKMRNRRVATLDAARVDGVVRCTYCRASMADKAATLDHDIPRARGGVNARSNLVAACRRCNSTKRDRTGAQFRAWLATYVGRDWMRRGGRQ